MHKQSQNRSVMQYPLNRELVLIYIKLIIALSTRKKNARLKGNVHLQWISCTYSNLCCIKMVSAPFEVKCCLLSPPFPGQHPCWFITSCYCKSSTLKSTIRVCYFIRTGARFVHTGRYVCLFLGNEYMYVISAN